MKQRKDNRTEYSGRQRAVRKPGREAGGESGRSLARSGKKSGKKTELKRKQAELTELARSGEKSGIKPGQPGRHVSGSRQVWRGGNMLYPVPAVMVSCARKGERPDIITVAWAGTVCSNPPMVSISIRPQRYSHDIIEETGEFVINLVTEKLAKACDWCGVKSGRDTAKFAAEAGAAPEMLTAGRASRLEAAPIILESPVSLECRVKQKIALGSHDMFLAEVVCVDVDEAYIDSKGRLDLDSAGLIAYSHGTYFGLGKKLGTFGYSVRRRDS